MENPELIPLLGTQKIYSDITNFHFIIRGDILESLKLKFMLDFGHFPKPPSKLFFSEEDVFELMHGGDIYYLPTVWDIQSVLMDLLIEGVISVTGERVRGDTGLEYSIDTVLLES